MRKVGLRARKSFRIFQRPGKSLVLGPLARRGYIREENPSHRLRQPRTCAPRRVNLHSSRISDTWLRTFESLRRETMIPVKTRKISWTHCSNIRTVFTWYVTNVACAYDAYVRPRNAPTLLSRLSLSPLSSTSLAFFLPHLLDDEPLPVEKFFANLDELETTCETVNAINTINVHRYFNRSKF